MDISTYNLQADKFKALAHPLRLQIIDIIGKKELCFSEILEVTGGNKSTLSQQLSMMVEKEILNSRKDSRCVYFKLSSVKVTRVQKLIEDLLREYKHLN